MSDQIKHECGIAFIRLKKPLEYYIAQYGTAFYGLNKLHLLMQKQHNRGQDGAGIASVMAHSISVSFFEIAFSAWQGDFEMMVAVPIDGS